MGDGHRCRSGAKITRWTLFPGLLALGLTGCNGDECQTPSCGDASTVDTTTQCKKDQVQCKSDEINAFGVCLAESGMVKVAAGEFTMGKTEARKDHSPEHKVTLKEFLLDKTEVTVAQYRACVDCGVCTRPLRDGSHTGREPYYGNATYNNYPVIYVTHRDAKAYCEGIGKRLPTEAEWEKAARGTQANTYPWGNDSPTQKHANFAALVNDTTPVTDYADKGAPCGALNMAGNVWEWVADVYDATYYAKSPASNPAGPTAGDSRVVRGGSFLSQYEQIRSFARGYFAETAALSSVGFRCARDKW